MKHIYLIFTAIILLSCKSNRFITEENYQKTTKHESVAVLPVLVKTTGNLPKNITAEELAEVEQAESLFFQDIVLASIIKRQREKRPFWVDFKSNHEVNSILNKQGIDYSEIFNYSTAELADMLDVDAVILTRVTKERYMSDLASSIIYGVDRAISLASGTLSLPTVTRRTYDVNMVISVVDQSETVLYKRFVDCNIDFQNSPDDAIESLSRQISRKFPYREYKY